MLQPRYRETNCAALIRSCPLSAIAFWAERIDLSPNFDVGDAHFHAAAIITTRDRELKPLHRAGRRYYDLRGRGRGRGLGRADDIILIDFRLIEG